MSRVEDSSSYFEQKSLISSIDEKMGSQLDFTLVRDVQYKFSKNALDRYFSDVDLSFIFLWFMNHAQKLQFV